MNKFKNEATIEPEFKTMLSLVQTYFKTHDMKQYKYHQCLVLSTDEGKEKLYSFYSDSVNKLVTQSCSVISSKETATIKRIVCMWDDGGIEVPAFQFMKKLCEINLENRNAEVLLSAGSGAYITKKIVDIIG